MKITLLITMLLASTMTFASWEGRPVPPTEHGHDRGGDRGGDHGHAKGPGPGKR